MCAHKLLLFVMFSGFSVKFRMEKFFNRHGSLDDCNAVASHVFGFIRSCLVGFRVSFLFLC